MLQILDFDNVRKRMSVIVRDREGKLKLYCKGADTMILGLLREDTSPLLRDATTQHLDRFAGDGLRTLCCAFKPVDPDYCADWMVGASVIYYTRTFGLCDIWVPRHLGSASFRFCDVW